MRISFSVAGEADVGDDGDAHAQFDIFLDDFPAAGLQSDAEGEVVLLEDVFDDAPGRQVAGRQDQTVAADVLQGDLRAGLGLARQRVIQRCDQHRVEGDDGTVFDVLRDVEHGTDGKIDLI
jgi:hypothetical protein